ncbi:MAG: hypothetical protein ABFS86_06025 [Planctomycetota bacterium]
MRIHAALLASLAILFAVLAAAHCGGGEAKAAFERYDLAVSPLLEEEDQAYRQFAELTADAVHFDSMDRVEAFIRDRLQPLNAKVAVKVGEIKPEGEDLTRIHGFLIRYATLRGEYLSAFADILSINRQSRAATQPARERLGELTKVAGEKVQAIQPAFVAAPEFGEGLRETLTQLVATAQRVQEKIAEMDRGTYLSSQYLKAVDTQVLPWLRKTKKDVQSLGATGSALDLQAAVIGYIAAIEDLIAASRKLAEARAPFEKSEAGSQRRVKSLQEETDRTLQVFREEARSYRNRLR